jgi:hypothetical protein
MPKTALVGNQGGSLESEEVVFDPESGLQRVQIWTGMKDAMQGKFNAFAVSGWKASISRISGTPKYRVSAQIAEDLVADRWERVVEWAQVDIKANGALLDAAGDSLTLAQWVADIRQDLAKNTPAGITGASEKQILYGYMAAGQESYETRRVVLRSRRTRPATQIANAFPIDQQEVFYSTAKLNEIFSVPAAIRVLLPSTPTNIPVPYTQWGWRLRTDDVEIIPWLNRAMETKEWVFAAWPLLYYTYIS